MPARPNWYGVRRCASTIDAPADVACAVACPTSLQRTPPVTLFRNPGGGPSTPGPFLDFFYDLTALTRDESDFQPCALAAPGATPPKLRSGESLFGLRAITKANTGT